MEAWSAPHPDFSGMTIREAWEHEQPQLMPMPTPRAVPMPRVMFTIPPAVAASRAGTAAMISALFAGVYPPSPRPSRPSSSTVTACGAGTASAAALAAVLYALAAAPGLVSDRDSTVPARTREAAR